MGKMVSKLATGAVMVAFVLAGERSASAELITNWDLDIHSSFSTFAPSFAIPGSPNPFLANEPMHLEWGVSTGFGPSELSLTEPPHSIVATNGGAVSGPTLTAINRPITDPTGQSLTEATVRVRSLLNPNLPPGSYSYRAASTRFFAQLQRDYAQGCVGSFKSRRAQPDVAIRWNHV